MQPKLRCISQKFFIQASQVLSVLGSQESRNHYWKIWTSNEEQVCGNKFRGLAPTSTPVCSDDPSWGLLASPTQAHRSQSPGTVEAVPGCTHTAQTFPFPLFGTSATTASLTFLCTVSYPAPLRLYHWGFLLCATTAGNASLQRYFAL